MQAPVVFETTAVGRAWLPQQQMYYVKSLIKLFFIWVSIQMKVTVKFQRANKTKKIELKPGSAAIDLLKKVAVKPDTVIVMRNSKPIPIDDEIKDGQEITIWM